MTPHEALEKLIVMVKSGIEDMATTFDSPDDDYLPTAFTLNSEGGMALIGIDPDFLATEDTKELLATAVLPDLIRQQNAIAAAFTSSAWQRFEDRRDGTSSARTEVVMVTVVSAFEVKGTTAPIIRHEATPPTLGAWSDMSEDEGMIDGLFPTGLRAGLARQG